MRIEKGLKLLEYWLEENGYEGYDPYDILSLRIFRIFQKNRYTTFGLKMVLDVFPNMFRKLFHVRKAVNAKAMALFAEGYLNLYKISYDEGDRYRKNAEFCLNWLIEHPSKGYRGYCWGYPFDWQSRVFIPRNTPSGVVTSIAGHAFLDAYEATGESRYRDVAKGSCEFIINELNIDRIGEGICFSYTPMDTAHVHNANLFCASLLYRMWEIMGDDRYRELGEEALKYTLSAQNEDGSWYYFGPPESIRGAIDNYHTGFVLRNLMCIYKITESEDVLKAIRKGLRFYIDNLIVEGQIPKFHHNLRYPVDIHACAESILCLTVLSEIYPAAKDLAEKVAIWTIANMQSPEGYFYYRKYRLFTSRIPYIRWGEAWMLYALSELIKRRVWGNDEDE